jgi:hypothetical protein
VRDGYRANRGDNGSLLRIDDLRHKGDGDDKDERPQGTPDISHADAARNAHDTGASEGNAKYRRGRRVQDEHGKRQEGDKGGTRIDCLCVVA